MKKMSVMKRPAACTHEDGPASKKSTGLKGYPYKSMAIPAVPCQLISNCIPLHFLPGGSGAKDPDSDLVPEPIFTPETSSWEIRPNGKDVVQA